MSSARSDPVDGWILRASQELVPDASMHIDKLALYFGNDDFDRYSKLCAMTNHKNQHERGHLEEVDVEFLASFEQILAHETFHIYQTLTSSVLSNYSVAKRREVLVALTTLRSLKTHDSKIKQTVNGINCLFDNPKDELESYHFVAIAEDRKVSRDYLHKPQFDDDVTLRAVIEGAAVAFQLLAQNDIFNTKVQLNDKIYKQTWELFVSRCCVDVTSERELTFARTVFLYLSDIYLRTFNESSLVQTSFTEAIDLVSHIFSQKQEILNAYDTPGLRDEWFENSLNQVVYSDEVKEGIINYCGLIDEYSQRKLFTNVLIYCRVFNRISPVGLVRNLRINHSNKHAAVNHAMGQLFPMWNSHLVIPCILSSAEEISKFINLWSAIENVTFIDDTQNVETSVGVENHLLQLYDDLKFAFIPTSENIGVKCCGQHQKRTVEHASECGNKDSLNSRFRMLTGKDLNKVIEYA